MVIEAVSASETSVVGYQCRQRQNPEYLNLFQHTFEDLNCRRISIFVFCFLGHCDDCYRHIHIALCIMTVYMSARFWMECCLNRSRYTGQRKVYTPIWKELAHRPERYRPLGSVFFFVRRNEDVLVSFKWNKSRLFRGLSLENRRDSPRRFPFFASAVCWKLNKKPNVRLSPLVCCYCDVTLALSWKPDTSVAWHTFDITLVVQHLLSLACWP
jgi:hypothetical protein